MITFEQFQATKTKVDDMGAVTTDEAFMGQPGFVYLGSLCINTREDHWPSEAAAYDYLLVIGRDNHLSNDLTELERILYGWALVEGYH